MPDRPDLLAGALSIPANHAFHGRDRLVVIAELEVRSDKAAVVGDDDEQHIYGVRTVLAGYLRPDHGRYEELVKLARGIDDESHGRLALPLDDVAPVADSPPAGATVVPPGPAAVTGEVAYANPDGTTTTIPARNRVKANELAEAGLTPATYVEACAYVSEHGWDALARHLRTTIDDDDLADDAYELVRSSLNRAVLDPNRGASLAQLGQAAVQGLEAPVSAPKPPKPRAPRKPRTKAPA